MRVGTVLAAICCSLLLGCGTSSPKASNSPSGKPDKVDVTTEEATTVSLPHTEAHKKQFVDSIVAKANSGDADSDMLDTQAVATKAADIAEVPPALRAVFIEATAEGLQENSLAKMIVSQVQDGGSFTFLRYSTRDGMDTAIFRSLTVDLILDYVELAIPPVSRESRSLALDVYYYSTAEWVSQAVADLSLQRSISENPSMLRKLTRIASAGKDDARSFSEMIEHLNHQDFAAAITAYHSLSVPIQQSKICLILRHRAAQGAQDEAERLATIEDMCRFHKEDACAAFLSIELHAVRKEYGKSISSIDRLDRAVGGDPYLDAYRASTLLEANDLDAAITMAKKALTADSSFELAHWVVARVSLAKSDFATTASELRNLHSLGKVNPDEIADSPDFEKFVASPEFKAWKAESEAKN